MTTERVAYLPDPVKREDEAGYPSPAFWERLLEIGLPAELISVEDVCSGCLDRFSVLCVPGGFVLNYQSRLGSAGAALIADFVRNGGGFVGVCAGAYLGSTMCLSLLPVEVVVCGGSLEPTREERRPCPHVRAPWRRRMPPTGTGAPVTAA